MPKDWFRWLDQYENRPELRERLQVVQVQIDACLRACPSGSIKIINLCAGDGRDLLGVLPRHPRVNEVSALLVEQDHRLVAQGQAAAATLGLTAQICFLQGDATWSNHYHSVAPADLVLVCGVFGNLNPVEVGRLIHSLPCLCRPDGFLIWTRGLRMGREQPLALIHELLNQAAFQEEKLSFTPRYRFAVGCHRYRGQLQPVPVNQSLFFFSGPTKGDAC